MNVDSGEKPPTASSSRSHSGRSSSVMLAKSIAVAFISAARSSPTIKSTSFPPNGVFNPPAFEPALPAEFLVELVMAILLLDPAPSLFEKWTVKSLINKRTRLAPLPQPGSPRSLVKSPIHARSTARRAARSSSGPAPLARPPGRPPRPTPEPTPSIASASPRRTHAAQQHRPHSRSHSGKSTPARAPADTRPSPPACSQPAPPPSIEAGSGPDIAPECGMCPRCRGFAPAPNHAPCRASASTARHAYSDLADIFMEPKSLSLGHFAPEPRDQS